VLVIYREYVKPGKSGALHEKTESAFVQALARAKEPVHYVAMNSLSGKSRALFVVPYESFEAWEKDTLWSMNNPTLSSEMDHAMVADGEVLESTDTSVLVYNEEYSLRAGVDMPHMRYFEIELFTVRPGHRAEWDEAVKLVKDAYEKSVPDAHWATYESMLGGNHRFVVITPMHSLREMDGELIGDRQFMSALGPEGMKKLEALSAAAIESSETNLFSFSPKMSYVSDEWIKADAAYWKPKATPTPEKKIKSKAEAKASAQ
jgi:hypothetical protein